MSDAANEHQAALGHLAVVERLWTAPLYGALDLDVTASRSSSVLVAESRCGYVPLQLLGALPDDTRVLALDPSRAMLDQARQRIDEEAQKRVFLVSQRVGDLSYADDVFRMSVCLNGVVTPSQVQEGLAELTRVTGAGGHVTIAAPLRTCFPEFYDILDEALRAHQLHDVLGRMYEMRDGLMTPSRLLACAEEVGLVEPRVDEVAWEVGFDSGQELVFSPLVRETFFSQWTGVVRSSEREPVLRYVADAIDTYWHDRDFTCTVVAGVLTGTR